MADIALAVGFANQAHLTHAFKAHMGQTPARLAGVLTRRTHADRGPRFPAMAPVRTLPSLAMPQAPLNRARPARGLGRLDRERARVLRLFLYATAAALVLGPLFFPASEPGATMLASLACGRLPVRGWAARRS